MTHTTPTPSSPSASGHGSTLGRPADRGHAAADLIAIVTLIVAVVGAALVAVNTMSVEAAGLCGTDDRRLGTAVQRYFLDEGVTRIVATGDDHDRYERTLVATGHLRFVSDHHDLDAHGVATAQEHTSC